MGAPGSLVGTSAATTRPAVHAPSRAAAGRPAPTRRRTGISAAVAAASTAIATSITPPRSETAKSLTVSDQGLRSSFTSR